MRRSGNVTFAMRVAGIGVLGRATAPAARRRARGGGPNGRVDVGLEGLASLCLHSLLRASVRAQSISVSTGPSRDWSSRIGSGGVAGQSAPRSLFVVARDEIYRGPAEAQSRGAEMRLLGVPHGLYANISGEVLCPGELRPTRKQALRTPLMTRGTRLD
jgi:hypothetical protein